jgi:hypothetical protein
VLCIPSSDGCYRNKVGGCGLGSLISGYGNEPSGAIKGREFLDQLISNYYLLRKDNSMELGM